MACSNKFTIPCSIENAEYGKREFPTVWELEEGEYIAEEFIPYMSNGTLKFKLKAKLNDKDEVIMYCNKDLLYFKEQNKEFTFTIKKRKNQNGKIVSYISSCSLLETIKLKK